MTELQLQQSTARLLDTLGLLWMHPANERKCTPRQGATLKRCGVKRGVPDVLVFTHNYRTHMEKGFQFCGMKYYGLAIELKVGRNKPTAEQKQWLESLERCGWATAVCHDIDEVIAVLKQYGYMKGETDE